MRSKLWLIMIFLILASLFSSCAGNVEGLRELTDTEKEAVVMVKAQYKGSGLDQHSGFIISPDGYIFTFLLNWDELEKVEVILFDGCSFDASVAAIDTLNGAARIKIEATDLNTLGLPQDVALEAGDEVAVAGYIDGRFKSIPAKVLDPNSTLPLPLAKLPAIKLNAGGEPGMVGGPVMDAAGHLVGAILAIDPETGESFMVPKQGIISMFFPTPEKVHPSSPPNTSDTQPMSRGQAIETASKMLPASIVARSDIEAELHGWYWEITFDNINAEAEELMPWALKPPPPPSPGQTASEPYPGLWQSVIVTIDAPEGTLRSMGASQAPRPGPYVSREQAISSAKEHMNLYGEGWIENASVEAYLRGDIWIVLFWEKGATIEDPRAPDIHRFEVKVDAVSGEFRGAGRG